MGNLEYKGEILSNVSFEYFPYNISDKTCNTIDIIYEIAGDIEYWKIMKELNLLAVDENVLYRAFETLSNGEQTKVLLAAMFLKENSFLLIDEPTNHLDSQGRKLLGKYLSGKRGYILVSHDRALLDSCVDHVISINRADIDVQSGNFSTWWEISRERTNTSRTKTNGSKKI